MVVADLLPESPGEEAVLLLDHGGWASAEGLIPRDDGVYRVGLRRVDGAVLEIEAIRALIPAWQAAPRRWRRCG